MRKRERFLRQSRMALCAAGLIGLGVTSANASLDFKFDVQSLQLGAGDTATNVAGQGYNQVLVAPGTVVGLQLNAVVNAAPPAVGATLGQQRGFWSTFGDFLSDDAGAAVAISAAGSSVIVGGGPTPIPAIDPFNKSGATAGTPTTGDILDVWMRKSPVTASGLGTSTEVPAAPNQENATSATWHVAKVNVTGQAAIGAGTSVVSYQPNAVDGVLFVDDGGVQVAGGTPATVKVSADAANITGKAVAKVGAAGLTTPSIGVGPAASLTLIGGGPVTAGGLSLGAGAGLEIATSKVTVTGGSAAAIEALVKAGQITSSAVAASPTQYGLGVATAGGNVVVARTILGDADVSGIVDLADFNTWYANNGSTTGTWYKADFDRSGIVDLADFNTWYAKNGQQITLSSISGLTPGAGDFLMGMGLVAVPEPASMAMLAVGALGLLARRRNR